jgi:phosphopentomutase
MAEVINLRQAKKQEARKAARSHADANAAKFGRTKAERDLAKSQADKASQKLDAHRRETD